MLIGIPTPGAGVPAWALFTILGLVVIIGLSKGLWLVITGLSLAKRAARTGIASKVLAASAVQLTLGLLISGISIMVPVLLAIVLSFLRTALQ